MITVRQATIADLEALVPLFDSYRQFYGSATDQEAARAFIVARFNHAESVFFLALENGIPLGFTQLYPLFSSLSLGRIFLLNDLFVYERGRKQGVGTQLLVAATEFARSVGATGLTLSTARTNSTAQSVYESAGWVRDNQFLVYDLTF